MKVVPGEAAGRTASRQKIRQKTLVSKPRGLPSGKLTSLRRALPTVGESRWFEGQAAEGRVAGC